MSTNVAYDDKVQIERNNGIEHRIEGVDYSTFRGELFNHPSGAKENIFDQVIDLTALGATYLAALSLPAGSVVRYVAAIVTELVVAGGTTVKIGLGPQASDTDKWLVLSALTVGTKNAICRATEIASTESLDVIGVVTAGTSAGNSNITAGKVRVVVFYETPNALD